jgi:phosphinothricin acetyltransferase
MTTPAILRLAAADDAPAIAAIYAPMIRDTAISFETTVVADGEMRHRIETTLVRHPWLVADDGDGVLGYAYATQHRTRAAYDWSVDVSAYLAPRARRRGLGRALYTALLDLLTAQGFTNAFAGIALPNPASVGLHEALGFTPIGVYHAVGWKLGSWHDVGWWQCRLSTSDEPPRPLVALPALDGAEVARALEAGTRAL